MRNVLQFVGHTLQTGTCASTLSTLALACAGHFETRHAVAPVNAISHWIWGDRAIHVNWPAWRYTAVGYLIHHATSVFWAAFYEGWTSRSPERRRTVAAVGAGLAVAAVACVVDLKFTPRRLTPGFERRLSPVSLGLVYLAFGLALPLATLWRERKRENARAIPEEQERQAA